MVQRPRLNPITLRPLTRLDAALLVLWAFFLGPLFSRVLWLWGEASETDVTAWDGHRWAKIPRLLWGSVWGR